MTDDRLNHGDTPSDEQRQVFQAAYDALVAVDAELAYDMPGFAAVCEQLADWIGGEDDES